MTEIQSNKTLLKQGVRFQCKRLYFIIELYKNLLQTNWNLGTSLFTKENTNVIYIKVTTYKDIINIIDIINIRNIINIINIRNIINIINITNIINIINKINKIIISFILKIINIINIIKIIG